MATLRALPSISTLLLNQPTKSFFASRALRLPSHVKISRHARQKIQGIRNEERISERFADEVRIPESFADEVRDSELFRGAFLERLVRKNGEQQIEGLVDISSSFEGFLRENAKELATVSLLLALLCLPEERALALNGGGPVMEEFWDNVRRYGFYFFTVVSGGLYSLAEPLLDLLRDPSTQVLVLIVVLGTFYLLYLTVSTMLGLNEFQYEYAQ